MSDAPPRHGRPLWLKYLTSDEVRVHLARDPRLIVPVGTTEQHGPHLPLGCDTIIVERLFQVLRAPTIEYGVNAPTATQYPGSAAVRRKTLHRLLNDLVGGWEDGGVEQFVVLTAHGSDPHQEAVSTLRTKRASVRTVDIFGVPLSHTLEAPDAPIHGGEVDTSLLLHIDGSLVHMDHAQDYAPGPSLVRRYHRGTQGAIPDDSPGSLGWPTRATPEKGRGFYDAILERVAERIFRASDG
jgi:creatinine amidohydrolase